MQVSQKHKAVLLRLRDPNRVLSVIPKARIVVVKGKEFVAVRHGPEETRVLNNMGFKVPSPIHYHYPWPGRFTPYAHQREMAEFMAGHDRCFNLGEMGVGKTIATLWAYDFLRHCGVVKKALVVTPLSTLERVWADEVFQHFPHLTTSVLHGSREKRMKMLELDADLYLINHDGIKVSGFTEALAARPDIDIIIVDELSQVGRTAGTDRFKALNAICNRQSPRRVWGLTGTPIPNSPTDAWAQCRIVVPSNVPTFFQQFRFQVMRQISQYVWVPRPEALETVQQAMRPAIRYARNDCIDLPDCVFETREVPLTPMQSKAYREMLVKLHTEVQAGEVTAVNEAVKAQKLIQIAAGALYGADREVLELDVRPRLDVVKEVIEEASGKVLVFVPFVSTVSLVRKYLIDAGFTTECVYGDVPKRERDRIFHEFQHTPNPRVLVAQPAVLSHGLTLTTANTIIWYAPITSADTFAQANARITRPGQKNKQLVLMLEGTDMERRYYERLKRKQNTQGLLLEAVRNERCLQRC